MILQNRFTNTTVVLKETPDTGRQAIPKFTRITQLLLRFCCSTKIPKKEQWIASSEDAVVAIQLHSVSRYLYKQPSEASYQTPIGSTLTLYNGFERYNYSSGHTDAGWMRRAPKR
ncbi:hypothetical protein EVAR_11089_1 [Eumeta japonica]|uniref:Uncharacterized protein n=1 Tax=Eumeta variegata TaxID=151549 RepID=A0A4C1U471_EUMVA|nr:hypothetical protein EVAR_11089_1 [Eumeta japonica]